MSDTICGMPYEEGDGENWCSFWREKKVKARKEHRCEECGSKIHVGEEHGFATGCYDGRFDCWRRCAACLILAEMAGTIAGACALWGGLDYQIEELNWGRDKPLPTAREHRKLWEAA